MNSVDIKNNAWLIRLSIADKIMLYQPKIKPLGELSIITIII